MRTYAALAAVALFSCSASHGPSASSASLATASPAASNPAESKAADLRTRLDLLLGEHVIAIAKESATAGRGAEYTSYLLLLTANGNDLTELVRSALGDTAATRFDQIWSAQNDHLVNYTIGLVTHNKSKADGAMSGLVSTFVPQFSQFVASAAQVPSGPIMQLVTQHVLETKAMIDDQNAHDYPRLYADLRIVYAQAFRIGDAFAPKLAERFPDKFPGNGSSPAVDLRVSMNSLLQEHLYLSTMATSAVIEGREAEQGAAAGALAGNVNDLAALFGGLLGATAGAQVGQIWTVKNDAVISYASAPTDNAKQNALAQLNGVYVTQLSTFVQRSTGATPATMRSALQAQVAATVVVIDDQLSRSVAGLGADDRSADASIVVVADLMTDAVVAKLRERFGA